MNDLIQVKEKHISVIAPEFPDMDVAQFKAYVSCTVTTLRNPPHPTHLPQLDCISERLVAPRLQFMQIRRLRHQMGGYCIVGQVINVPVDVNNIVTTLSRQLDDDYSFNVRLKRNLIHKNMYLQGCIKKAVIKRWLEHLIQIPLYEHNNIEIDPTFINVCNVPEDTYELDEIKQHSSDTECLLAQQHPLLWNEDKYLGISPGQNNRPLIIIYDEHAEGLSFPSIYLGQARTFKTNVKVTPCMIATSEIRHKDRRGVTPQHIL
jgi:hypothetical protein